MKHAAKQTNAQIYLENSKERNSHFYEKCGFTKLGEYSAMFLGRKVVLLRAMLTNVGNKNVSIREFIAK